MPWQILGRMLLKQVLGGPDVKKKVMAELRAAAQRTESKIDDNFVDVADAAWDLVIPILVGKL